jgi:hypothetical protein
MLEIVQKVYYVNGECAPFWVAIVDDPAEGDTKLVIMFEDEDFTAVLSLDDLIENEDVSEPWDADVYENVLREHLWDN